MCGGEKKRKKNINKCVDERKRDKEKTADKFLMGTLMIKLTTMKFDDKCGRDAWVCPWNDKFDYSIKDSKNECGRVSFLFILYRILASLVWAIINEILINWPVCLIKKMQGFKQLEHHSVHLVSQGA